MARLVIATVIVFASLAVVTDDCSAGWWKRRAWRRAADQHSAASSASPARRTDRYIPEEQYRDIHPKYYWGFHSRDISNIGIPSSQIGLRGNGMIWTPW